MSTGYDVRHGIGELLLEERIRAVYAGLDFIEALSEEVDDSNLAKDLGRAAVRARQEFTTAFAQIADASRDAEPEEIIKRASSALATVKR